MEEAFFVAEGPPTGPSVGLRAVGPTDEEHYSAMPQDCTALPAIEHGYLLTLVTGPRRSLSLKLSDTRVYEPLIRARLGNHNTPILGIYRKSLLALEHGYLLGSDPISAVHLVWCT